MSQMKHPTTSPAAKSDLTSDSSVDDAMRYYHNSAVAVKVKWPNRTIPGNDNGTPPDEPGVTDPVLAHLLDVRSSEWTRVLGRDARANDIEDVIQDAALILHTKASKIESGKCRAYARSVARNLARCRHRQAGRYNTSPADCDAFALEAELGSLLDTKEELALVLEAIRTLGERDRAAIVLSSNASEYQGLDVLPDTSEESKKEWLGLSADGRRKRLSRARYQLNLAAYGAVRRIPQSRHSSERLASSRC